MADKVHSNDVQENVTPKKAYKQEAFHLSEGKLLMGADDGKGLARKVRLDPLPIDCCSIAYEALVLASALSSVSVWQPKPPEPQSHYYDCIRQRVSSSDHFCSYGVAERLRTRRSYEGRLCD